MGGADGRQASDLQDHGEIQMIPADKRRDWAEELGHVLEGTTLCAANTAERLFGVELSEEDATDLALDAAIERCRGCLWWVETCMLHESERIPGKFVCDQCEPEPDE